MSRFAHHASSHAADAEFELVQDRYIGVPLLTCALAVLAALAFAVQPAAPITAAQAPLPEACASSAYGA